MAQQLLDLINRFGGQDAVAAMAAKVGISPEQAQQAMGALMPAVAGGMQKQVEADGGAALNQAAAGAAPLATAECAASDAAVDHGHDILGQIFGGHDVTSAVTEQAAAKTGIDAGTLAALLPMVATMAAGALGQHGGAASAGEAAPASGGLGGILSGMLGGLTGGGATGGTASAGGAAGSLLSMLDQNKDGNPLDDIMGFAQRFMKK